MSKSLPPPSLSPSLFLHPSRLHPFIIFPNPPHLALKSFLPPPMLPLPLPCIQLPPHSACALPPPPLPGYEAGFGNVIYWRLSHLRPPSPLLHLPILPLHLCLLIYNANRNLQFLLASISANLYIHMYILLCHIFFSLSKFAALLSYSLSAIND